jgi:hypothetical protein
MMKAQSLERFPLHLGLGAKVVPQPEFTGMEWFAGYVERNAADGHEEDGWSRFTASRRTGRAGRGIRWATKP